MLFVLFFPLVSLGQDFNKMYYNSEWQGTSMNNSIYYRMSGFNEYLLAFDGKVVDVYTQTEQIEMVGYYENGVKNGDFVFYYPDGNIKLVANYLNNERIGTWKEFYPNGTIKKEVSYIGNKELLIQMNNEEGKSILRGERIRIRGDDFRVRGRIVENRRHGRWRIWSDGLGTARLKYSNGILIRGSVYRNSKRHMVLQGGFPLIKEPAKFIVTEKLTMESGAVIRNNYVLEGMNNYKIQNSKKITIHSQQDFEAYINNSLEIIDKYAESKIRIIINFEKSKPVSCEIYPNVPDQSKQELLLILAMVENVNFIYNGSFEMDYIIKLQER